MSHEILFSTLCTGSRISICFMYMNGFISLRNDVRITVHDPDTLRFKRNWPAEAIRYHSDWFQGNLLACYSSVRQSSSLSNVFLILVFN